MRRSPVDRAKIKAEHNAYFKDQGINSLKPLKGQTDDQMYDDIKKGSGFIKESLQEQSELKAKQRKQEHQSGQAKRMKEAETRYFAGQDAKAKQDAKDRTITITKK